jgi:hypothetical protein
LRQSSNQQAHTITVSDPDPRVIDRLDPDTEDLEKAKKKRKRSLTMDNYVIKSI